MVADCIFCIAQNERIILINNTCRAILCVDKFYVGYVQVISNIHVKELSDLPKHNIVELFDTIMQIETRLRQIFNPDKINIASLGNMVPHLHWHIIPRFKNDRHFPNSIWGEITNLNYKPSCQLIEKQEILFI